MFTPRFQIHVAPRIHHFVSRALVLDILLEEEVIEERKSGKRRKEEMEKKGYILSRIYRITPYSRTISTVVSFSLVAATITRFIERETS